MPAELPGVSVIMPVLNEERHLRETLDAIEAQDYAGEIEVVVAHGPSTDGTAALLERLQAEGHRVVVVDNPTGRTAAGLNAAIAATGFDVVVRVDGHAVIPSHYVRTGVETLQRTGAVNVGGIMDAVGQTTVEEGIACAMKSPLGVGSESFHTGGGEGPADTVYLGTFRRDAIRDVGGYDEEFLRAQDWEMNMRLRRAGGLIWFTPDMRVTYRPRASFRRLARQYFDYGTWRREVMRRNPETKSLRYLAPPVAVAVMALGLLVAVVGAFFTPWALLGLLPLAGYLALVGVGGLWVARSERWPVRLAAVRAMWTMHLSWGTGFLLSRPQG